MRIQGFDLRGQALNPADIVLVTDVSGSMDDDCSSTDPPLNELNCKIRDAQRADISFLDNVNLHYMHAGLIYYSSCPSDPLNIFSLSDNYDDLVGEINSYDSDSYTNMGGGMELAMHELLLGTNARPGIPKYMIVMTDGLANYYYTSGGYYAGGSCRSGTTSAQNYVRSIAQQAENNGIIIYGIAFGSDADTALVREITTNGQLYYAPDGATLTAIYNQIAQNISVQDFPTPTISSTVPRSMFGWSYPTPYSGDVYWDGMSCGDASASCTDFRSLVQSNLGQCTAYPCDIRFSVYSSTVGMLNLSELFIELNEPPVGNYPPIGNCFSLPITCPQTQSQASIDNAALVTDQNDPLNTLTWAYSSSIESAGGSYFNFNSNYNSTRQLVFTADPARLDLTYWRTFFFNITDPWGALNTSCINVSYAGCAPPVCGNGPPPESGEECEFNNTVNNTYCSSQSTINCTNQPRVRIRDQYGDCNATCGCTDDDWGPLTCIAGNCTAACTSGTSQHCFTPDGYLGNQSCNDITCNWNACISTLYCGDGTVNGTETCERPYSYNNYVCSQIPQDCLGARTRARDAYGDCNASCGCNYDFWTLTCVKNQCPGAECNDGEYRLCIGGIQFCDSATCKFGPCTTEGRCGDGTRNNISEQCEPNDDNPNSDCTQENESCVGALFRTRPSQIGRCNAACQCYNDTWSSATCTAGKCGAACNAGDTQNCDLGGGITGIQTCNINTCQWNTCTPLGTCGDGIRNQITEQCDYPPTQNNPECSQENESCTGTLGTKLITRPDLVGNCDGSCQCYNDTWSSATCVVGECGAICSDYQTQPCTIGGQDGTQTCDSDTCRWGTCIPNPIECKSPAPKYLLHTAQSLSIDLSEIFDYSGQVTGASGSANHFTITHSSSDPNHISVSSNEAALETFYLTLTIGSDSKSCPVTFLNVNSNCDRQVCDACTTYDCLNTTIPSCLDGEILVTDPWAEVNTRSFLPYSARYPDYTVDLFTVFDGFDAYPSQDDPKIYFVTNKTDIPHNYIDGSKIILTFNDFTNPSGNEVRICPALRRFHYDIGVLGYDPNSTLLITGSRAVTGFYERNGFVFSKGPYIFIAKVWLRE
jgi:hypothetical protein